MSMSKRIRFMPGRAQKQGRTQLYHCLSSSCYVILHPDRLTDCKAGAASAALSGGTGTRFYMHMGTGNQSVRQLTILQE